MNGTWHTRMGIFYSLKPLLKTKSKNNENLSFLLRHTTYFLFSILAYFVTTQLNHFPCAFSCIIQKIPISQNLRLFKLANFLLFSVSFFQNLLSQCGDIEKNPGPKYSSLRFCHWNLNGLIAHDCIKITLIQAYITDQNFDIVCLSETFLNSSIQNDDHKLKIDGYNLIRSDHPSDSKKMESVFIIKNLLLLLGVTTFAL